MRVSYIALLGALGMGTAACALIATDDRPETLGGAEAKSGARQEEMTPELRAAYVAAVQTNAGVSYRAERDLKGARRFANPDHGFGATIDGEHVLLSSDEAGAWDFSLSTAGVGCNDTIEAMPAAAVESTGNRVEIARGENVREWYVNGPLGLEQGYTLERAPACDGTKVVTMDVGGSVVPALLDEDGAGRGSAIALLDSEGASVARYADLYVKDATGKRLASWMTVEMGRIALHVEDEGATYPIEIDPLVSVQQAKLVAADAAGGDGVGITSAIDGNTAVVAAWNDDVGANSNQGSAYVFVRSGATWTQQAKLVASDGGANDQFGVSVALQGDTIVVGAYFHDVGANGNEGSAYVFNRNAGVWSQSQILLPSDGVGDCLFGGGVAISGTRILVGSENTDIAGQANRGAGYVFNLAGGVWTETAKLTAPGTTGDQLGNDVALDGNTAVLGAHTNDNGGNTNQGAAFVFVESGGTWTQEAKVISSDGGANDLFGEVLALSGNTLIVGAPFHDVGANVDQGSAYIFVRNAGVWTQQQALLAPGAGPGDHFGNGVDIEGTTAIVGAPLFAVGANSDQGSAFTFTQSGGVWSHQATMTQAAGNGNKLLGYSVSISGDTRIAGAPNDDAGGAGSELVFVWRKDNGDACANALECGSNFCVDGVCCNAACGGGAANDCQACATAAGAAVNGTCGPLAAGTTCRMGAGLCDVAEACDGAATACPADSKAAAGTECRPAGGACDTPETCDGAANTCPADMKAAMGTECRPSAGACDTAESCNGVANTCPADSKAAMGTECRASGGACDIAEACNGMSNTCPADTKVALGTECRASAGACDTAESCDGAADGCPADTKAALGTECRPSAGACDTAESCDGAADGCPADTKAALGTECRASAGECDALEACDGAANDCPADVNAADGTMCTGGMCTAGACMGGGGAGGSGGAAGSGGAGGSVGEGGRGGAAGSGGGTDVEGGCACRAAPGVPSEGPIGAVSVLALGFLATRRRRGAATSNRR